MSLVVLLVVVLLKLPSEKEGKVKLAISGSFLPLFGAAASARQLNAKAGESIISKDQLASEVEDLRRENEELKIRLQQDASVWSEDARLRSLVGWSRQTFWKVRLGRVIARDPANWWRSVQIDLGTRDGIRTNDTVLTADGLVGRVQSADYSRAQVILLGSPELRVAAAVATTGQQFETGVISATSSSPQENGLVDLEYLQGNSKVRPGQEVFTWGQGGVFPARIPIGKVFDVQTKEYGLATEARVKLAADLGALQEVWVVTP